MHANPSDMRFFGAPRQTAPATQIVRADTEADYFQCLSLIAYAWTRVATGFKGQSPASVSRLYGEPTFVPVSGGRGTV